MVSKYKLDSLRDRLPPWKRFLIVDDSEIDSKVLRGVLRVWLGYDIEIDVAATLGTGLDQIRANMPDVLFLDHYLPPQNDAAKLLPYFRNVGFQGPIVVLSGMMSRNKRNDLVRAGIFEALHKDELDTMSIGTVLLRIAGVAIDE